MTTLYDIMMCDEPQRPSWWQTGAAEWRKQVLDYRLKMSKAVPYDVTQPSDFFFGYNPKEEFDIEKDFPQAAMPHPVVWMEWRRPARLYSSELGLRPTDGMAEISGCLIESEKAVDFVKVSVSIVDSQIVDLQSRVKLLAAGPAGVEAVAIAKEFSRSGKFKEPTGIEAKQLVETLKTLKGLMLHRDYVQSPASDRPIDGWVVKITPVYKQGAILWGPHCTTSFHITKEGTPRFPLAFMPLGVGSDVRAQEVAKRMEDMVKPETYVPLLAASFLNCKRQATTIDTPPDPEAQRCRRRRGLPKLITIKTLEVAPLREAMRRASQGGEHSSPALHLVRGHFKRYTAERPLFGRYTGVYWHEQHIRGSEENGIVEKDYRIALP